MNRITRILKNIDMTITLLERLKEKINKDLEKTYEERKWIYPSTTSGEIKRVSMMARDLLIDNYKDRPTDWEHLYETDLINLLKEKNNE